LPDRDSAHGSKCNIVDLCTRKLRILTTRMMTSIVSAAADRPARRRASCPLLCTDVDGQCDKLTDDGHQFTTLTICLS